ncbi:alpha-amylase family glycosyl hydrolase, partial [Candidatus Pseudoruminococcus sp.]|uniref:alpha-amylase family glycosyl hydrolase n=1 Tax=Candidatus Pseudoruminococcus sp. TaxID=3101048 RepID=UPI003999E865
MTRKSKFGARVISAALAMAMVLTSFISGSIPAMNTEVNAASTSTSPKDTPFSWDNATVYFLLTDRFYNGDTSNDHSYGRGLDKNGNVANYDQYAAFQGGDFAGITKKINEGYFNDLGVNAIWLSAPYEQIHGYCVGCNGNSFAHYSYHGYYVLDYTESDANFGTKAEFQTLVDTAHEHGIRIVMDIVMNHAGYNTLKDMDEFGFGSIKSGWDSYYYAHQNINNNDYHGYIDYNASADVWGKWWGSDWIRCGLPGYTEGGGDIEMCLAGLPDFKTGSNNNVGLPQILKTKWNKEGTYSAKSSKYGTSNTVTGYISDWLAEWVRDYGVDGFRCDTAKHVELSAWKILKTKCVAALKEWKQKNPTKKLDDLDFWMTGECFGHQVGKSAYYTEGGFDSMINFEFAPAVNSSNIPSASSVESTYSRYASSINNDDSFNVLSYISSHDTVLAKGDRKYAGSFLLMLPGAVQIYYGDETNRPLVNSEFANVDPGAGHQFRSFMNWDSIDKGVLSHWQKVGTFRNNHLSVGAGQHKVISSYDSSNGYTFSRTYNKNGVEDKIIATLFAQANKDITIDVSSIWGDGMVITNCYDDTTCTVSGGKVTFNSGANGTILLQEPQGAKGKVIVKHINQDNGEVLKTQTMVGLIGESYTVSADSELTRTYDLVRTEGSTSGTYSETDATVTFYYHLDASKFGTVSVSYVDASTGTALADSTTMTGKIGETYSATPKTIKNYEVDLTQTNNATGTYKSGNIKVVFKYNYVEPTNLQVHYYNSNNWSSVYMYTYTEEGSVATEYNGKWPGTQMKAESDGWFVGEAADTESALVIFNNGSGVQEPSGGTVARGYESTGEVWIKNAKVYPTGKVKVIYTGDDGKVLAQETLKGMVDGTNKYTTSAKTFEGYTLSSTPSNASGVYTADTITVSYVYKSNAPAELVNNSTISATTINKGQSITMTAAATGGTAPYTYTYFCKSPSSSSYTTLKTTTATSYKHTPTSAGTYSYAVRVTDSTGNSLTNKFTVTVKATTTALANNSTISATSINFGSSIKITAKATGGKAPYKYRYFYRLRGDIDWTAITGTTTATTCTHKPTKAANYQYAVRVFDSTGKYLTKTFDVNVKKVAELANASTISATSINLGSSIKMTAKATGGKAPYKYSYFCKPAGEIDWVTLKNATTATTYTYKPTKVGTYYYAVRVFDSTGKNLTKQFTVNVNKVAELANASTISATSINLGSSIKMTAKATGGKA